MNNVIVDKLTIKTIEDKLVRIYATTLGNINMTPIKIHTTSSSVLSIHLCTTFTTIFTMVRRVRSRDIRTLEILRI
ncbi:hypothetical protein L484_004760 [Morus notabilis]|uniref:Uncharacterized protein n=1 Tax=Morus notabilis TaxID=981085 RepID=W9QV35_9ROSA|nr:hypothetical protein L484_004760 [Morus notabilis]